jgi:myo-inositol-1-phosphate synthase
MTNTDNSESRSLLLLVAGAKGTVASTVAVALATMRKNPQAVLSSLTTRNRFPYLEPAQDIHMAGWDIQSDTLTSCIKKYAVLPDNLWGPHRKDLDNIAIFEAPTADLDLRGQIEHLMKGFKKFREQFPNARPVLINLLPACAQVDIEKTVRIDQLYSKVPLKNFPDLAYALAAVLSGIPIANLTPNFLEVPVVVQEAIKRKVPLSGSDAKTGQTYLKIVLASALKARNFYVDGWYSLNILGNTDGKNLMDPERAAGKITNKTGLLDDILGYPVGQRYGEPSHKVHIDYYPPRGDAKEAWDVIDFQGLFGLPMSIRLNLQARDSILAAPLVLDLARWMAALKMAGRSGPVAELGFYYKKPLGDNPPLSFQDQIISLEKLEAECDKMIFHSRSES